MESNPTKISPLTYQMLTEEKHTEAATDSLQASSLQLSLSQKILPEQMNVQIAHRYGGSANTNGFCIVSTCNDGVKLKVQDTHSLNSK